MPERFDLERRAEELFTTQSENSTYRQNFWESRALQLARELAEAIAAECAGLGAPGSTRRLAGGDCADIARSFARPRSREEVLEEELRRRKDELVRRQEWEQAAAVQRALDWRQP